MAYVYSNSIDLRLPVTPETNDPELYRQLLILYNAVRQLHTGIDAFFDIPPKQFSTAHTLDITDRGHSIDTSADVVIPPDTSVPWNIGSTVLVTNITAASINITPGTGVTLVVAGTATTGARILAQYGMATLRYLGSNIWIITGAGLS